MILVLSFIAIVGAFVVAQGKPLFANYCWIISNPLMAVYNYRISEYEMAMMFGIYSLIAAYGIWNLKISKSKKKVSI